MSGLGGPSRKYRSPTPVRDARDGILAGLVLAGVILALMV